jgi:hypothetical protein
MFKRIQNHTFDDTAIQFDNDSFNGDESEIMLLVDSVGHYGSPTKTPIYLTKNDVIELASHFELL